MPKCEGCEAADPGNQPFIQTPEGSPTSSTTPQAPAPPPVPPTPPGIFSPPGAAPPPENLPPRVVQVEDDLWEAIWQIESLKIQVARLGAQFQQLMIAVNNIQTRLPQNGDERPEHTEGAQTPGHAAGEEHPESAAVPSPHHPQGAPSPQESHSATETTTEASSGFELVDHD